MKAAVLYAAGDLRLEERAAPEAGPREVLVEDGALPVGLEEGAPEGDWILAELRRQLVDDDLLGAPCVGGVRRAPRPGVHLQRHFGERLGGDAEEVRGRLDHLILGIGVLRRCRRGGGLGAEAREGKCRKSHSRKEGAPVHVYLQWLRRIEIVEGRI